MIFAIQKDFDGLASINLDFSALTYMKLVIGSKLVIVHKKVKAVRNAVSNQQKVAVSYQSRNAPTLKVT
jgi:hypothetical protein